MRLELSEPYAERPTEFVELWEHDGWRVKVYGVAHGRAAARPELVETAKRIAAERLPRAGDDNYGVGFVGVHDGRGGNWIFVDWWSDENVLHHHLYHAPGDETERFEYVTPTGVLACVFELRVVVAEREAWIDTVLANPRGPDLDAYVDRRTA